MLTERDLSEYLGKIREHVCTRCPERPRGGPPCAPLGKTCGVEAHLAQLVESIQAVQSQCIDPYLAHNRMEICNCCEFRHGAACPCAMDYLSVLLVEAVEAVDQRRAENASELPCAASGRAPPI
jgi:hypothetical protein